MSSSTLLLHTTTQAAYAMPTVINNTQYVPAFNGSLINSDDCTAAICSLEFAQLNYVPSFGGNLAYLIVFAIVLLAQLALGSLYRTWGFLVGLTGGLLLEIIGYVGRLLLHQDDFNFNNFIMYAITTTTALLNALTIDHSYLVCLTIAPAFLSASIYLCLSRLIVVYGQSIARFSAKFYTILFVCCDLISLILQAAGGAVAATADSGSSTGQTGVNIMIAGLAFQVASLTIFMVLSLDFILAVRRVSPSQLDVRFVDLRRRPVFRLFPWALALATVTIFIRCCFRVAELKDGFGGSIANNQTLFMVFEGPMIIIAVLALTFFHPGLCFGGSEGWQTANWSWKRSGEHRSLHSSELSDVTSAKMGLVAHDSD